MKLNKRWWRKLPSAGSLLLVLGAGLLMGLAPAPLNLWPLAWFALIPLWRLVVLQQHWTKALLLGAVWGTGYHGLALSWITGVHPMTWMGVPWFASLIIAVACWTIITLWGAVLVGFWSFSLYNLSQRYPQMLAWQRVLLGTTLWCSLEWLWSQSPLWWTTLAYTQSPGNLAILHLGQLAGPLTVTAVLVVVNGCWAEAWLHHERHSYRKRYLLAACLSWLVAQLIGSLLLFQPLADRPGAAIRVGIIQGNIPNEIKLYPQGYREALEGYTRGYNKLVDAGVNAILLPEGALPYLITAPTTQEQSFFQAVRQHQVLAWTGAFGRQGPKITNSLFTLTGQDFPLSRYDKVRLVPLGEYIPFESVLGQFIGRLSPLEAQMAAGSPHQQYETPWGQAIVSICYESAYADHLRQQAATGGRFILSAANNAHYSATMPAQHHAQDVMRAIETNRWVARATNTGYSAFINPHGQTLWRSQLDTFAIHAATIYTRQTLTPYVRWGSWIIPALLVLSGAVVLTLERH